MEFMLLVSLIVILILVSKVVIYHKDIEELKGKLAECKSDYDQLRYKLDQKHNDWVHMVNEYKKVKHQCDLLKQGVKYSQSVSINFTQEDLKRMKHYLHPDKHNGKTNDLFIKVNESLKQE